MIEEQPRKENIKKFLRAIEISKEIELENIEELINGEYEIDRSEIIETIQAGREKLVSIQGNAGSGKSVVCKKLLKGKEYVLVTRAENLSTGKKVNELWDCDVEDAILWLENKPLYIFIDAIEFIADCGDNAFPLLQEIYRLADKYSNVYIITSCRTMLPKNAISRAEFVRLLNAKEDGDSLSIKSMTSSSIPEYLLTQLFLNALTSPVDEMISFNNLSGKLLCFRPSWLNKDKENFIWGMQCLEVKVGDDMCVNLVAHRMTSLALKKQMKFEKRKLQDYPQYEFSYNNNTLKRVSNENKDRRENFIIKPVDGERGSITFFDFTDYETFSCTKMGVLYDILNALHDEFGKYIRVKFKQYSIDEVLEYKVHTDVTEELDVAVEEDLSQKKTENIPKWPDGILDYLDATERNKVLEYACNLQISQSTRLHKMLVQYKKDIADYKSKLKEAQSRPYYNPRHNKPENEPAFFKEMSDECMSRAIAILDTVFKSIESLGGSINSDLSVRIRGDIVRFRMVESQDQVKHEMTKQEAQALVKYNDDIKNHRWASKPQIRKYDKVYNGKLRIVFGERSYIRDNDSEKLEDRLGDILVTLYEKAEENRIVREAREEAERKRVEEARRREENRQRKEQEIRLVKELVNKAEDYRIAKEIREYIQAMIDSGNEDITPAWIEWARKKADWYDPSIATEDEYLGKRQHEKNAEEKEKSLQDSIRKSWYW